MSFTGTEYSWGGGSSATSPSQVVQQLNPAYSLNGTETGAVYQTVQEVAGDLYIASNAKFDGTNWVQTDATKASYALRFRSNGSIVERVTAPSSAPTPIVWTTVFSINTAGNTVVSGTLNVTGSSTLTGVNVGGAITGATTINASGQITGAGIAAGGAITGATSITMSGALSGGTATFTAPLPLGSGGTGATTLAGANIAVTNANNNFSTNQTVTGTMAATSFALGANVIMTGVNNMFIYPPSSGGAINIQNFANTLTNAHFLDAGGLVLDRGNLVASTGTLQGTSNGSTVSYCPPVYLAAGTIVSATLHCVQDKITAAGASTSVTLAGAAAFTGATTYVVYVEDTATGAVATITAQAASSFTFTSTSGHVYSFFCIGT